MPKIKSTPTFCGYIPVCNLYRNYHFDLNRTFFAAGLVPAIDVVGDVEFRDVHFYYPTRQEVQLFNGLNLAVPNGSVTAVVGSSGSGKSTLAALLMRFYDPSGGAIYLDGLDIKSLSPQWLRSHIGIVNQVRGQEYQDVILFLA